MILLFKRSVKLASPEEFADGVFVTELEEY